MHASSPRLRRTRALVASLLAGLSLLTSLAGCGNSESSSSPTGSGPLQVVASINQWQSLAEDLGGNQARVDTILSNTSTDAHDYEPTTADIARISRADLVIVNGAGIRLDNLIADARKQTQGRHYAATESAAYYLCHDLGMEDLTPEGYLRAAANESEPSPEDLVAFRHLLTSGQLDMLVLNVQEVNRTSKELAIEARKAHVPVFEVSEQRPDKYRNLEDWISALVQRVPGSKA